ncbi:hypothetical protein FRB94_003068 [Tulasnella sp. JGI-2019a]|nr:hypothetical protein FRB94_003068 [Tulasnella sp. JGI-2019a]
MKQPPQLEVSGGSPSPFLSPDVMGDPAPSEFVGALRGVLHEMDDIEPMEKNTTELPGAIADAPYLGVREEVAGMVPNNNPDDLALLDGIDVDTDPLYQSLETIYDDILVQEPDDSPIGQRPDNLPPAFKEDPTLRNIYIRIFVQAAYKGATKDSICNMFRNELATLRALQA